jgi:ankyrin repeat protein
MESEIKMMRAIRENNIVLVQQLLSAGKSPNFLWHESTPLLTAISAGYKEMVILLLTHGAQVQGTYGSSTALLRAVSAHDKEMVTLLLTHKAPVDEHVSGYDTPLLRAIKNGHREIVQLLLAYNADPNYGIVRKEYVEDRLQNPLLVAIKRFISFSALYTREHKEDALAAIKLLLQHKANPNSRGNYKESTYGIQLRQRQPAVHNKITEDDIQETPLSLAATAGENDLISLLLDYGALLEGAGGLSELPLHAAVVGYKPHTVQQLLQLGAFINSQDFYGQTAVHQAAYHGISSDKAYQCLTSLLDAGADVNVQDYEGNTPLMYLFAYCSEHDSLEGINKVAKALVDAGTDLTITNVDHETAKTLAYTKGITL